MRRFLEVVDAISEWTALPLSLFILLMMLILLVEVVLRYLFHAPTIWSYETCQHLFAGYAILGGAYVLLYRGHVRMDVLYLQFSPRGQAILDVLTYLLFFLFIVVMLVYGVEDAVWSWSIKEVSKTPFHPPMYPLRTALPVGAFLILLQGLAHFIRALHMAIRGRELE
jgi:TRAP-type mannitol/chloroaromatic compound transport system permease small subunit